jgi:DNA-binding MarR family transcriptional regulator
LQSGLNATDTKCVDLILRAPSGALTAGQLSSMTGLTTGAVTHIVDRLEKRGFVERQRDPADRRKVFLRVVPESLAPLLPKYELVGERHKKLLEEYSVDQLLLIIDYLEKRCAISQKTLEEMISLTRSSKAESK